MNEDDDDFFLPIPVLTRDYTGVPTINKIFKQWIKAGFKYTLFFPYQKQQIYNLIHNLPSRYRGNTNVNLFNELSDDNKIKLIKLRRLMKKINNNLRKKIKKRTQTIEELLSNTVATETVLDIIGDYVDGSYSTSRKITTALQKTKLPPDLTGIIDEYI